jgi:hypothetical protein
LKEGGKELSKKESNLRAFLTDCLSRMPAKYFRTDNTKGKCIKAGRQGVRQAGS